MNNAVPDCPVTGYEGLIDGLTLPDPDDRHVLAAAIRCQAGVIVTYNLKDFPDDALTPVGSRRSIRTNSSGICSISIEELSASRYVSNAWA